MAETREIKRFRANPVEIMVLLIATGVFCHSVYDLFNDSQSFSPAILKPLAASPVSESARSLASTSQDRGLTGIELHCGGSTDLETTASRTRLSGLLCGADAANPVSALTKAQILNATNQFNATVSTDIDSERFTTDFIPLDPGRNAIQIEFAYRGGRVFTQEVDITRN